MSDPSTNHRCSPKRVCCFHSKLAFVDCWGRVSVAPCFVDCWAAPCVVDCWAAFGLMLLDNRFFGGPVVVSPEELLRPETC
jgi:hypothetical protein